MGGAPPFILTCNDFASDVYEVFYKPHELKARQVLTNRFRGLIQVCPPAVKLQKARKESSVTPWLGSSQ